MKAAFRQLLFGVFAATLVAPRSAWADPCGMVPPIWLGEGSPLTRVGIQKTYVFHKDGVETLVLRPGFEGDVEEFGMLIPFPSPPVIRKVPENVFAHLAAAVDPPEVVVDLRPQVMACREMSDIGYAAGRLQDKALGLRRKNQVVVLREEAVGMYEVAVLAAGGAEALARWMTEHGFQYPEGMDDVCEEYIEEDWCFVAVKARVGAKDGSEARPGMREADVTLPVGTGFDGHVQAMGFRFRVDELVVPMRLASFNPGELHNVVYVLSEQGCKVDGMPDDFVVRQVPGSQLYRNVVDPLPLRIVGGGVQAIPEWQLQGLPQQRNPEPHNGIAKELFATDLFAARGGELALAYEENEKALLDVAERLGLRGDEIDALLRESVRVERERAIADALTDLSSMTLTVIDGDVPRELIASRNLTFPAFAMSSTKNDPASYDAKHAGPAPVWNGTLSGPFDGSSGGTPLGLGSIPRNAHVPLALFALLLGYVVRQTVSTRVLRRTAKALAFAAVAGGTVFFAGSLAAATPGQPEGRTCEIILCRLPAPPERPSVSALLHAAATAEELVERGQAIVALTELTETDEVRLGLQTLLVAESDPLARAWIGAALIRVAESSETLLDAQRRIGAQPIFDRPLVEAWSGLLAGGDVSVELVLEALTTSHTLQQKLLPSLLAQGPAPFVDAMLHGERQEVRRLAAASLATMAQSQRDDVAAQTIRAVRFAPSATQVAWDGGPLFVPSLGWTPAEAQALVEELLAWLIWCDLRGLQTEQQQLHNNLRSVGLANVAGYQVPDWNLATAERWLIAWGRAQGTAAVERLLAEQGLTRAPRFQAVLGELGG
jgi:hypothetical protein